MTITTEVLKKIILDSGLVTEANFDEAEKAAAQLGKTIPDVLVFQGMVPQNTISQLIAQYLGVPYINLKTTQITDEALTKIPENLAETYRMVPLAIEGNTLKLLMEDPTNIEAIEFAKRTTGLQIMPCYLSVEDMRRALASYKRNIEKDFKALVELEGKETGTESDLTKAAEKLSIVKVLDTILTYGVAERASDIHIESHADKVVVRYRVDGDLRDIVTLPKQIEEPLVARIKILSNLKLDERRIPQDGRHKITVSGETVSLRISIIPGFYGENVVLRILRESARPYSLEELGLTGHNLSIVLENIKRPNGMILVTGPTGSGKTTTLYSVLSMLNTNDSKVCTIEDPIEYGMNRVTQIQVNPKAGLDFAAGLRALLRHDPNIIMVGEIRDKETAEIAVHSALTGHLVLSTLHTNDAAGAIPRLLDMGIEGYLAASTINAVIAQRLVRKICTVCTIETKPDLAIMSKLTNDMGIDTAHMKFYKGKGCVECHGSGFSGRIGIYEVLPVSEKVRSLVIKKVASNDILQEAKNEGMLTMLQDGISKVSAGLTTIDQVLQAVIDN
ncbi:type II/IV secretion system protein [Candidatus Woesebacteria bacterium]|jgi:type IV pilus assembly protein PilB|nr:type II/IV secretion system protein [Candidatus Woesebacteria bacterium]MBP9687124.1 type II/IV secretion system protein [Candidatus Woesebacteria bacterium]